MATRLIVASLLAVTVASAQNVAAPSERYTREVTAYRKGESASPAMAAWSPRDLRANVDAVRARLRAIARQVSPGEQDRSFTLWAQAAAVLHTEAALDAAAAAAIDLHLDLAESIVAELPPAPFRDRWYAFAGSIKLLRSTPDATRPFIDRALRATRRAPHVRVLAGIAEERRGHLAEPECLGPKCDSTVIRREGRTRLALAEEEYREALRLEPQLLVARLRLGRVLFMQGRLKPAREELEAVKAAAGDDRELTYLAHLFLGALSAFEGDLPAARREYAAAVILAPEYQTSYVALSFTEAMLGEAQTARELAVLGAAAANADDPAQVYPYLTGALKGSALDWLRAEVRR